MQDIKEIEAEIKMMDRIMKPTLWLPLWQQRIIQWESNTGYVGNFWEWRWAFPILLWRREWIRGFPSKRFTDLKK